MAQAPELDFAAYVARKKNERVTGDSSTTATSTSTIPTGIDRFLLFPNPIQSASTFETNTAAYAQAYYRAIDSTNAKDTLTK